MPAARSALEELLSYSLSPSDVHVDLEARGIGGGGAPGSKKGDLKPLLRRLPPECARACFLTVPQVINMGQIHMPFVQ